MENIVCVDYRDKACGSVPEMQVILARAEAGGAQAVEFRIRAKVLPQVVGALGLSKAWRMFIEEGPGEALVRFTRRDAPERPSLDLI